LLANVVEVDVCRTDRRTDPSTRRFIARSRCAESIAARFFLALLMGASTFNLFYSFLAGLLMAGALYLFALWATKHDPQMLRILLSSSRFRARYDAAKHAPFHVELRPC
jgi:hypothetical protein